jgi:hypothetical protein
LGRRATLCTLESMNYTQRSYSRNTFLSGPRRRSRASSRDHTRSSKNRGLWWDNFHRSASARYRCTRRGKGRSTR